LEQTSTENYDLRLEWYPQDGEIVSLSTFYKEFTKPVEKIARVKADQQNYDLFTENLDRATVKGVELNFRKSFGFVAPALSDLWLTGNLTALEGNVAYSLINDKERNRPLQGLAPYVINGSALYESVRWGAAVNYTRMGRILVMSGEYAKHDEYENPRNVLDLQFYVRFFSQQLEVKLNLSDLLNEDMIVYRNRGYETAAADDPGPGNNRMALGMDYNDGDYVMSRISRGVNLSLSVSYKL
jgi:outer membrane receptor protein involved in Fe transport